MIALLSDHSLLRLMHDAQEMCVVKRFASGQGATMSSLTAIGRSAYLFDNPALIQLSDAGTWILNAARTKEWAMNADRPPSATESRKPLDLSADEEQLVRTILDALARIRHGSIQLVVQDSRVIQIDTVEKRRLAGAR
jgi:hypothetical protein